MMMTEERHHLAMDRQLIVEFGQMAQKFFTGV